MTGETVRDVRIDGLRFVGLVSMFVAYYVREVAPGRTDNTWSNVIGLTLAAVLLAVLWRFVVRPKPWHRGPLEGPVELAVGATSRTLPGR